MAVAAADATAIGAPVPVGGRLPTSAGAVAQAADGHAGRGVSASAALRAAEVKARQVWAKQCLAPMLDAVARAAGGS